VTNIKMKTLSETKQQRLQKDKTAHMQHQLWKVWDEYRPGLAVSLSTVSYACAFAFICPCRSTSVMLLLMLMTTGAVVAFL